MKTAVRRALVPALLALCAGSAFPFDFGALLEGGFEAENSYFSLEPRLTPWFSWDNGKGMSAYLSCAVSARYVNYKDGTDANSGASGFRKPAVLPELTRFSFSYAAPGRYSLEAGRVEYTDVLGQTASGLFDGFLFRASAAGVTASAGAFYTGLAYKETARILMTGSDSLEYARQAEDFGGYFASKRILAFGRLDMPFLEYHNIYLEALAQFDLNGGDEKLDSQYMQVLVEIFTGKGMRILGGFVCEVTETGGGASGFAFGALASAEAGVPGRLNDSAKLTAKFSSGPGRGGSAGYTPLTSNAQGMVFPGVFSGLWQIRLDYEARILPSLFAEAGAGCFGKTYNDPDSQGLFYGGEMWASLAWRPFEDARVNFGAGVFLPGMNDAYPGRDGVTFRINAGVLVSF